MQHRIYLPTNSEYIEFYEDSANEYRWRVISGNNEKVGASSEGFNTKQGAVDNLKLTVQIATKALATLPDGA